jgi:sporulation protein YlmC with PRC-barrel domain
MMNIRSLRLSTLAAAVAAATAATPALAQMESTEHQAGQTQQQAGQQQWDQAGQTSQAQQAGQQQVMRASDLIGKPVRDQQGQELGDIADLAVNVEQGELAYLVLSTGGFLQGKDVGISLDALQQAPDGEGYVASISQEQIEAAEGLPEQDLPAEPTLLAGTQMSGAGETAGADPMTDATGAGQTADAGQMGEQQPQDFAALDQDGDGYISESEAQAGGDMAQQFDQIDENADNQIDRSEFAAFENELGETEGAWEEGQTQDQGQMQEGQWEAEEQEQY